MSTKSTIGKVCQWVGLNLALGFWWKLKNEIEDVVMVVVSVHDS